MFQNNKKAGQKLHALARISSYINTNKTYNAFFLSQFEYCLLVRNFHNRSLNKRIKRLQDRASFLVYKGTNSSIAELLEKENSIEIYKGNHKISSKLIRELFQETEIIPY